MRALGLIVGGVLALTVSMAGHAAPSGSSMKQLVPASGTVHVWGGCGWGWHPVPGHWSRWRGGWVPPHCAPNHIMADGVLMALGKAPTEFGVLTAIGEAPTRVGIVPAKAHKP